MDNGLNPSRISGGNSRTTAMNISFMIWLFLVHEVSHIQGEGMIYLGISR